MNSQRNDPAKDLEWHLRALGRYADKLEDRLEKATRDSDSASGGFAAIIREFALNYWRLGVAARRDILGPAKEAPLYLRGLRRLEELGIRIEDPESTLILPGSGFEVVASEEAADVPLGKYFVANTVEPRIWYSGRLLTEGKVTIRIHPTNTRVD